MTIFLYRYIYHVTILVVLITLLTTCSSIRFIYGFMDKFIQDEIAYFLDLDEEEEVLLSQKVTEMVDWHRTSMLPSYAAYLTNIADKLDAGRYGSDDISMDLANGRSLIEETVIGLTPYASKFLMRHQTVEDIEFMEKRMKTRRQERLEQLSQPEDILYEERLERLMLNFDRFLGNLNDAQVVLLEIHAREIVGDSRVRLNNRTQRQKIFTKFLRKQPTELEITAYLNKLLLRGHVIVNPAHEAFSEVTLNRFKLLLVNMLAISSPAQRDKIISKLREYADDFKAISS